MDTLEVVDIISKGEDSRHQFKVNITNADSLAAEMVAFANSDGGMILIGVSDEGTVVGLSPQDIRRLNQLISNTAANNVKEPLILTTTSVKINDKVVLLMVVPEGIAKPYRDNQGVYWVKNGADKSRITSNELLRRLYQNADLLHADETPVERSTMNDVDLPFFQAFYRQVYEEEMNDIDIPLFQLLENLNLAREGRLNYAGLLLFGKNPHHLKPAFIIKAVSFVGTDPTTDQYRDSEDIQGKLKDHYEIGISFLLRNLRKIQNDQGFNSLGKLEVPKVVLEELVVNALIHRNYFINAPIRLFIFDDRLEIISPGTLPNSLSIDNIKNGVSTIRNPVLTSFATKQLPYRGIGTGIRRALKSYPAIELINDTQNNQFIAVIQRPA